MDIYLEKVDLKEDMDNKKNRCRSQNNVFLDNRQEQQRLNQ